MRFEVGRLSSIRKLAKTRVYRRCNETRLNCAKRDHGDNCERLTRIKVSPDVCQKGDFRWARNARNYLKWPARKLDKTCRDPKTLKHIFQDFVTWFALLFVVYIVKMKTQLCQRQTSFGIQRRRKNCCARWKLLVEHIFTCNNRCSTLDRNTSRSTATPSTENARFRNTACGFVRLHENLRNHFDKSVVAWVDESKEFQSEWMLNQATN